MFCHFFHGVLVVGAGSGGWRGGLWRNGLWDVYVCMSRVIHGFRWLQPIYCRAQLSPSTKIVDILGPFFLTVRLIGNQRN